VYQTKLVDLIVLDRATITDGSKKIKLSDLKPGMRVKLELVAQPGGFPAVARVLLSRDVGKTEPAPRFYAGGRLSIRGMEFGAEPRLTVVNRPQFKVEFQITRVGPSGLGTADVYLTTDEGQTWEKTQNDEPLTLLPWAPNQPNVPTRAEVTVRIPRPEIAYGVYVVVKSKAGVGAPPPQRGTKPMVRVELDTTPPEATLRLPVPDTTQENVLTFLWTAADRNLSKNPIALEYSETPTGPWKTIGQDLPNTGRYAWQVPSDVPPRVYLKMAVRDLAGNCGVVVTKDQVVLDLVSPKIEEVRVGRVIDSSAPKAK
jgi:hypothetical protein